MPEIRWEAADDDVAVLDGYCSATGKSRTDVIRALLHDWSASKLKEAETILRVVGAGLNPACVECSRNATGKKR